MRGLPLVMATMFGFLVLATIISGGALAQGPIEVPAEGPRATAVATGHHHACVRLDDGRVRCWGSNDDGQLGERPESVPGTWQVRHASDVPGLPSATEVTAGGDHTCALLADTTVRCWGSNVHGQLGDGTSEDSARPVRVLGLDGVMALAAGSEHTCALLLDGSVRCWGSNEDGQLGAETTGDDSPVPVVVAGLAGAVDLRAGPGTSCAIVGDGTASCWGRVPGQPGSELVCETADDGSVSCHGEVPPGRVPAWRPETLVEGQAVRDIALGKEHACVLLGEDGTVVCWGRSSEGQLGDGSTGESDEPVSVVGLRGIRSLAAGWYHTCALAKDGAVRCWGDGSEGELGYGRLGEAGLAVAVANLADVTAIDAEAERTCALRGDGSAARGGYRVAQDPRDCPLDHCAVPIEIDLGAVQAPTASDGRDLAPARFRMEIIAEDETEPGWAQADGFREASASGVLIVQASDPRISGTLTLAMNAREFSTEGDPGETFGVMVGRARIENAAGAWVGTLDGFWTDDVSTGRIMLAGVGTYEGLHAIVRLDEHDGVIFGLGLPPMPASLPSPRIPDGVIPTPDAAPSPTAGEGGPHVRVPAWPAPPADLRVGRSLGDPGAAIRLDIYQDAQCPPCARFSEDVLPLLVAGPVTRGDVFLTYHDLALLGPESLDAAVAMRVAEELGRFWDYERLLLHNQGGRNVGAFSHERLADIAEAVGLDRQVFLLEMDDPAYQQAVEAEGARAGDLGIGAVPALVMNGTITIGSPTWEELRSMIAAAQVSLGTAGASPTAVPTARAVPAATAEPTPTAELAPTRSTPASPAPAFVLVGDFLCLDVQTTRQQLASAGLSVGVIAPDMPVSDDSWLVLDQVPAPGTEVPGGTAVDLRLGAPDAPCP